MAPEVSAASSPASLTQSGNISLHHRTSWLLTHADTHACKNICFAYSSGNDLFSPTGNNFKDSN